MGLQSHRKTVHDRERSTDMMIILRRVIVIVLAAAALTAFIAAMAGNARADEPDQTTTAASAAAAQADVDSLGGSEAHGPVCPEGQAPSDDGTCPKVGSNPAIQGSEWHEAGEPSQPAVTIGGTEAKCYPAGTAPELKSGDQSVSVSSNGVTMTCIATSTHSNRDDALLTFLLIICLGGAVVLLAIMVADIG